MPPEWSASAIAFAQMAVSREPENAEAHFGLALAWLQDAIDFGWTDYALARRDPALVSLPGDERFHEMMRQLEARGASMR